jgi:hypothetical protein
VLQVLAELQLVLPLAELQQAELVLEQLLAAEPQELQ